MTEIVVRVTIGPASGMKMVTSHAAVILPAPRWEVSGGRAKTCMSSRSRLAGQPFCPATRTAKTSSVGLLHMHDSDRRVSGCHIRDDRPGIDGPMSLRLMGRRGNMVVGNLLGGRHEIDPAAAHAEGNHRGR
jgi:hypothetical protein